MTLYELSDEYMALLRMAEEEDLDPEALRDTLEGISGEMADKAESWVVVIKELEAGAAKFIEDGNRQINAGNVMKNNASRMKDHLCQMMTLTGQKRLETEHYRLAVAGNGGKKPLRVTGEVPEAYLVYKPSTDTAKIREALESGVKLDFAHLEERGVHLAIK